MQLTNEQAEALARIEQAKALVKVKTSDAWETLQTVMEQMILDRLGKVMVAGSQLETDYFRFSARGLTELRDMVNRAEETLAALTKEGAQE